MLSHFASNDPHMPPTSPVKSPARAPVFAITLMLLGSFGIAAAWVLFALATSRQASWFAILAALDAVLLLRLGRMAPGWPRALAAVLGTALAIALANWGIAAGQMGKAMGLLPWESLTRLGPDLAWTLAALANPMPERIWLLLGLLVAGWWGR